MDLCIELKDIFLLQENIWNWVFLQRFWEYGLGSRGKGENDDQKEKIWFRWATLEIHCTQQGNLMLLMKILLVDFAVFKIAMKNLVDNVHSCHGKTIFINSVRKSTSCLVIPVD